uniref:EF-hand domain-containing protein n=1 Tax=Chromulina nebulosa TaxID=96789 RepID=A0A7S0XEY3_9STRA|mmetsp:Transcript_4767/g.4262  ORF Transcript_4767/g.4262 Transcript_4767/m.4262 type:complete len:270 (+) Transcript_4767:71-880(+)|eukprot:CAMPEP_0196762794 /NCGR_PEP_ID=MMETSP1095-20130614/2812_1 /TAXON_ID=96789 ORGANISM="Chromulina nebulosa, Strain UTEXLB2642" /NCGR_SAMPLE_ID=MMETSP1095 /ASSEMBLY_ACC=CAM_ASM_000446 /LENGTH=269 /DNA_ID=CAMNT_0042114641 /DNA_START=41 /DNA_END=850 /DNA_ORIENTATION=-
MTEFTSVIESVEEQRELFLWKFDDVPRPEVNELVKDFKKRDVANKGEIEEIDVLLILEKRGNAKTATELRLAVADMDKDKNHKISFLELACAIFSKPFDELNNFTDEEARKAAFEKAMKLSEKAREAELEIEKAKEAEEKAAQDRAEAIERERNMTGVKGAAAFFKRQAENVVDETALNKQKISEEAARRKALRDAKQQLKEAMENANKSKSIEEVQREIKEATERAAEAEAAMLKAKEEEEKAVRAARKAALNAKWSGSSTPTPVKKP